MTIGAVTALRQVLIAEDNEFHALLLRDELSSRFTVLQAADTESALELLKEKVDKVAAMAVDLGLPPKPAARDFPEEGVRLIQKARTLGFKGPIVAMVSGRLSPENRSRLQELEVTHVYEKPFSLSAFGKDLESLLAA